jgi:hypothetical protein
LKRGAARGGQFGGQFKVHLAPLSLLHALIRIFRTANQVNVLVVFHFLSEAPAYRAVRPKLSVIKTRWYRTYSQPNFSA